MIYVQHDYVKALSAEQKRTLRLLPWNPVDAGNHAQTYMVSQKLYETYLHDKDLFFSYIKNIKLFIEASKNDVFLAPYAQHYFYTLWSIASNVTTPFNLGKIYLEEFDLLNSEKQAELYENTEHCKERFKKLPWGSSMHGLQIGYCTLDGKDRSNFERQWLTTIDSTCSTFMLYKAIPAYFKGYENLVQRHMALQLAKPKARKHALTAFAAVYDSIKDMDNDAHDLLMRALTFEPYDSYMTVQLEKTKVTPEMMFMHLGKLDDIVDFQIDGMKRVGISGTRFISFFRYMVGAMEYCSPEKHRDWLLALTKGAESLLRAKSKDAPEVIQTLQEKMQGNMPVSFIACLHVSGHDQTEALQAKAATAEGQSEFKQWLKETRLKHDQLFAVCLAANYHPKSARLHKAKVETLRGDLDL
jgi:hypothetical protein